MANNAFRKSQFERGEVLTSQDMNELLASAKARNNVQILGRSANSGSGGSDRPSSYPNKIPCYNSQQTAREARSCFTVESNTETTKEFLLFPTISTFANKHFGLAFFTNEGVDDIQPNAPFFAFRLDDQPELLKYEG